jgi:hypothetical protein
MAISKLRALQQFVIREIFKDAPTGVMRTLPNQELVDMNVQVLAQRLMQGGIDPTTLKNANQVENAINMIESRPPVQRGITSTKSAKVFDMEGQEIPKGSKIMGGKAVKETEAEMAARMKEENKEAIKRFKQKMEEDRDLSILDPEDMAQGGRAGFDEGGMTRRTFLKILGGLASIPIVGKILKPVKIGKTVSKVPVIKTAPVEGKPEWFDSLVNKVIAEGDDVTKRFATGERQSIHQKTLDDGSVVRVTEDTDQGAVRVEYESSENVFGDPVQMEYKRPLPDEATPDPAAEFTTAESGPVGRQSGPDDYDIEIDEVGGTSIRDLDSDVSKLKEYATGKKPTIKEMMQNKRRKDKAAAISEDSQAQSDAVIRRQGDYTDDDFSPDFASGGIAGMLGE